MIAPEDKNPEIDVIAAGTAVKKKTVKGKITLLVVSVLLIASFGSGAFYYHSFILNQSRMAVWSRYSQEMAQNKQQLADLQRAFILLQQHLQQQETVLRQQIQAWHGLSPAGVSQRGYDQEAILDAQYFVKLANEQLAWTQDIAQALLFLDQAQHALASVAGPPALALKKALAQDKTTLKNIPAVNVTNLYQSILLLQQQADKLPLLLVPAQQSEQAISSDPPLTTSGWEKGLHQLGAALRQMVRVYHLPSAHTVPFITPDQRPYIFENLQAILQEAQWAVLHHNAEIYNSSLQQATDWIRRYFSTSAPPTQQVLNALQALQAISVQPAKEILLVSPKVFEQYVSANGWQNLEREPARAASTE